MAKTVHSAAQTADATIPEPATPTLPRRVRLVRVVVLLVSAMAIIFTATMHENLTFDRMVIAVTLAAFAIVQVIEWSALKPRRHAVPLLQAAAAVGATVGVLLSEEIVLVAVVIAAWALVSALLEFIAGVLGFVERSESATLGAMGVLLALAALLAREDAVAAIGFFGVYALVAGVYLGISAFDERGARTAEQAERSARA